MTGCRHTFDGSSTCALCRFTLPATFTPLQVESAAAASGEPLELAAVKLAILEQRDALCRAVRSNAVSLRALAEEAFRHHAAGDLEKRNYALNAALDIECESTGDCRVLGPLADLWGLRDDELDPVTPGAVPS